MTAFNTQRELPASPEQVFAAFQDPVRLARWWGPDGFTNQFAVFDFQPGGRWVFTMIGPDGKPYHNEAVFQAIEPARRIVVHHLSLPVFTLTISLQASTIGTLVHWEQAFADAAVAQAVRHIVEPANEQNLNRWTLEVQG